MFKLINKWICKLAKWVLSKNAPPGEHLAYINDEEAHYLKKRGGAGVEWNDTGIKSYFIHKKKHRKKIGRWFKKNVIKPTVKFFKKIGSGVANAVGSLFGGTFGMPDMGSVSNAQASNDGILLNKAGTLHNIPVVYGQRKVGGTVVFLDTEGSRNEKLYVAMALCEGEIEGYDKIFIDGVDWNDSRFTNYRNIERFEGDPDQIAKGPLTELSTWTSNHRLRGLAYLGCKFTMPEIKSQDDADKNPWGGVPQLQAVIRGKKIASAATAGASDYATETAAATTTSSNPADIILDYLRNPVYGRGLSNDRIQFSSFASARQTYDTTVTYADGGQGKLFTMNAVIDTGDSVMNNLKKMLVQCRSGLPYIQGKFHLKPLDSGSTTSPVDPTPTEVFHIEEQHITDGVEIIDPGTRNQANQVRVSYIDPNAAGGNSDWSMNEVIYPEVGSARDLEMLAEDGNKRITKEYNLEFITNPSQAGYHAKLMCENERKVKTLSVSCTAELHFVEIGDIVKMTYAPLGINGNFYRVMAMEITQNYEIELTLREHQPGVYGFGTNNVYYGVRKQRQYVGDTQRVTRYVYNHDTDRYEPVEHVLDSSLPTFPNTDIPVANIQPTDFAITATTLLSKQDSPTNPIQTNTFTVHIEDYLVDALNDIYIAKYNPLTQEYEARTKIIPGIHRTASETYQVNVPFEMDGSTHTFVVIGIVQGLKIYKSVSFSFVSFATIIRPIIQGP